MELYYSNHYKKSDFQDIAEISKKREYVQKSLESSPIIIIAFVGTITTWFLKGYFSKLGELTAENHFKQYQDFKNKFTNVLFRRPKPIFGIRFQHKDCVVRIFYKAEDVENFEKQLDITREIYNQVIGFIDYKKENIKMLTLSLDNEEIVDFYYVDLKNDIYTMDK